MRWYGRHARLIRGERIIPDDFPYALRHMPSRGLAVLGVQRGDSNCNAREGLGTLSQALQELQSVQRLSPQRSDPVTCLEGGESARGRKGERDDRWLGFAPAGWILA